MSNHEQLSAPERKPRFEPGDRVCLRADLDPDFLAQIRDIFEPGRVYVITSIIPHKDEGGDAAYLQPQDASAEPLPISVRHLERYLAS